MKDQEHVLFNRFQQIPHSLHLDLLRPIVYCSMDTSYHNGGSSKRIPDVKKKLVVVGDGV